MKSVTQVALKLQIAVLYGQTVAVKATELAIGDRITTSMEDGQEVHGTIVSLWYKVNTTDGRELLREASLVTRLDKHGVLHHHALQHEQRSELLAWIAIFGGFALMTALGLSMYERLVKPEPLQQSPHSQAEEADRASSAAARKALRHLFYGWLTDDYSKCAARCASFLVVGLWLIREFVYAFFITKVDAEVVNAISAVHESRDLDRVYQALMSSLIVDAFVGLPVFWILDPCVRRLWDIQLRKYVTRVALTAYINGGGHAYYKIKLAEVSSGIDNPDQRMTEDVNNICDGLYNVMSNILSSVMGCSMWMVVIIQIANWKVCAIYLTSSILRTSVALFGFGGSLTRSRQRVLMTAASLRYALTRIRDSAEEIAFAQGDKIEYERASNIFMDNVRALWHVLFVHMRYGTSLGLLGYFPHIFMWLLMIPRILNGQMGLGDAQRVFQAMGQLDKIISFFVNNFDQFTELQANADRLHQLLQACETANWKVSLSTLRLVENPGAREIEMIELQGSETSAARHSLTAYAPENEQKLISYTEPDEDVAMALKDVRIFTPDAADGIPMGGVSISCNRGEALLFVGASGLGKTSLVRTLSGLWTSGFGTIARPGGGSRRLLHVVPSRCYLPIGTLLDVVCYPKNPDAHETKTEVLLEHAQKGLSRARLEYLPAKWGWQEFRDWRPLFSTGEQQRIGFARLFLDLQMCPSNQALVVLDEATGNLDVDTEADIYSELRSELSIGGRVRGVVSVGHRPSLLKFHESVCVLGTVSEEQEQYLDKSSVLAAGTWQCPDGKKIPWQQLACTKRRAFGEEMQQVD